MLFRSWAGDPEGGAPYVEASPTNPNALVGFDVEIAELMARGLGLEPRFVLVQFASIDQSVARGDAEIGLSGIEDSAARRASMSVTLPYYEFREVLSVRDSDAAQFRRLADLAGRRVGTLGGTLAYEILLAAERNYHLTAVSYEDDVHPFSDLALGRLDAVLLDNVLAERRRRKMGGFAIQPESVAVGHYVGVLSKTNAVLRDRINDVLRTKMRDGTLEQIFKKWDVWNADQPTFHQRVLNGDAIPAVVGLDVTSSVASETWWNTALAYLPLLLRASVVTLVLSCLSMALAVMLEIGRASCRERV